MPDEQERRLANAETLLNALPMPAILLDDRRTLLVSNETAKAALQIGASGNDLAQSLRSPKLLEAVDNVLAEGANRTFEMQMSAAPSRVYEVNIASIRLDDVRHALAFFVDKSSARRVDAVRSAFVANVSHELRSPLTTLMGAVEALEGPARDDPTGRTRMLTLMGQEARRMRNLIDDLLSLSRVEASEFIPPGQKVVLRPLLEAARDRLSERAASRDMTIDIDVPDNLPKVPGVEDELFQAFDNLINNAIKYGDPGTSVKVHATHTDEGVRISINNAGAPIPTEHLPRLTERFYRIDKSRSRELGGTGLGLAIVKHIINRHSGRLAIESSVENGATFSVILPGIS